MESGNQFSVCIKISTAVYNIHVLYRIPASHYSAPMLMIIWMLMCSGNVIQKAKIFLSFNLFFPILLKPSRLYLNKLVTCYKIARSYRFIKFTNRYAINGYAHWTVCGSYMVYARNAEMWRQTETKGEKESLIIMIVYESIIFRNVIQCKENYVYVLHGCQDVAI